MATFVMAFLVLFSASVQGYKYVVKVTSSTPEVHVGVNVSLDCSISPPPSEPYWYRWSAPQAEEGWTTSNTASGSTLVAALRKNSTRHVRYFCSVYSGNTLLASGSIAVEAKGRSKNSNIRLSHSAGALQLEVLPGAVPARLSWYHNSRPVDLPYDARLQLSNTTSSLFIRNATKSDTGTYVARVGGLELARDDPITPCGRAAANLLQAFAVVAPTEFTVYNATQVSTTSDQSDAHTQLPLQQQMYVVRQHIYVEAEVTLIDVGVADAALVRKVLKVAWYHNGLVIPEDDARYTSSFEVPHVGAAQATLVVADSVPGDAGIYTAEGFITAGALDALESSLTNDCRDHVDNLTSALGLERIVLGTSEADVVLFEPPHVVLTANQTILSKSETSTLTCSLVGVEESEGAPTGTVRWLKGGRVVSESRGTTSQLLTSQVQADLPVFGKYSCVAVSLHYAEEKSLVLLEEARFEMQLKFVNETHCTPWEGSYLKEVGEKFVEVIVSVMSHVSRATITSDNIVSPSMTCQRGGTSLLFRGTLVYADVGGNVTASSVLLLTDRVVNGTLMLGAQLYYVSAGSGAQEDSSGGASQLPDGMHMNEGLWIGALIATIACVAFLGTSVTIATIILCRKYSLHHIGKKSQGWISMNSVENQ